MRNQGPSEAPPEWQQRERPPTLSRRFQFNGYSQTRYFLDELATLSEECGYYPDTSFGANYVSVTINARDGAALSAKDFNFAARIDKLMNLSRGGKQY
ncbi:MAG: 4a-hydroxytetrahydrobiopterin dehydratase [Pseudomonadota bacterium]